MPSFFRRLVALLTGTSLALTFVPVSVYAFTDVGGGSQYAAAINDLSAKGVVSGYANGSFQPSQSINRAEFLKIALGAVATPLHSDGNCFPDVTNQWFAQVVCTAKDAGIVNGYPDGNFHPENKITFAEAGKILSLAYKQDVSALSCGQDWYEPYALALESSKAIPPSVAALDKPLTRGEMAEMIWRLTEKKTDQPTKGFLNVKYPDLKINTASDTVQYAKSCQDLRDYTAEQQVARGPIMYDKAMGGAVAAPAPMAAQSATNARASNHDYSQTNLQVQGVDESDIVKTDGTNVYEVVGQTVRIVQAVPATNMKQLSSIDLTKDNVTPSELYVNGTTLVVLGSKYLPYPGPIPYGGRMMPMYMPIRSSMSDVRLYDISNASAPKLLRDLSFDGYNVSSRRIGQKLYLVLTQPMFHVWPIADNQLIPQMQDSAAGSLKPVTACTNVAILPHVPSPEYLTVAMVPLDNAKGEVKTSVVLGDGQNVYSSLQNLYVATTQWHYSWNPSNPASTETTNLYRFGFTNDGIALQAQGSVPGNVLNQFSMDENGSTFRIATTTGQTWDSSHPSTNNLYILNMDLNVAGKVEDVAKGESIYAVRFIGNRAYMVTFQSVDPLFVIDVSDPRAPKVLGQLNIPGYSNYLEPYDATHLIGFGKDVDASIDADKVHSPGAVYYTAIQGMKVALFDVSDVAHPKQLYTTSIGDRGTDSPVLMNHKALLFEKDRNLLSFPVTVTKMPKTASGTDQSMVNPSTVFQGAYVYTVTLDKGFQLKGTISHYDDPSVFTKSGNYWFGDSHDIQRVIRINDSLVTVSNASVRSNALLDLQSEGKVELPNVDSGGGGIIKPMMAPMQ